MFGKRKADVLVVGGGPVGLFTAVYMARAGMAVEVIDQSERVAAHTYALALQPAALVELSELGILDTVLEGARRITNIGFYDGDARRVSFDMSAVNATHPFLAVMGQDRLEGALAAQLKVAGGKLRWNHRLDVVEQSANGAHAKVQRLTEDTTGYIVPHTEWVVAKTYTYNVPVVVGADGYRSTVRHMLDIDFEQVGDDGQFAVFEFKTDQDLGDELRIVLTDGTSNVCWPLPDGYCRWSFGLKGANVPDGSRSKNPRHMNGGGMDHFGFSEDDLRRFIKVRAPWFTGSIEDLRWRTQVRFPRRLATTFGHQRCWLVGDAAHTTGPVIGQSMNRGFIEGRELGTAILKMRAGQGGIKPLQAYGEHNHAAWEGLLGRRGGLVARPDTDAWLTEWADVILPCLPGFGDTLKAIADGLGFDLS